MDVVVTSHDPQGNEYNKFGQLIIKCRICNEGTTMLGTKLCDRCWELDTKIRHYPVLAKKIISQLDEEITGA